MKRRSGIVSGWIGMGVGLVSATVFAQGSLTPPGPPAPLMKTLHEVEPRIPVTNLPFTISRPGSYYVTTSLTGVASQCGITIAVDSVTLDLNGFELRGVAGSHHGIWVSGTRRSIAICNGSVRDWGWRGVDASAAQNSRLIGLTAYTNGWGLNYSGLAIGSRSIVRDCVVEANAYHGISAGEGCMLGGCVAGYNGVDGVAAGDGCRVNDCVMSHNTADGLQVANGCRVTGNTCDYNGSGGDGAGIHATGSDNRIEGNSVMGNDRGLDIDGENNYVADNTVRGNTGNYDIAAGNHLNLLISQIPQVIDWPASVRLAGSLTGVSGSNGVTINSDAVTLDLAGHALIGVAGSLSGIYVSGWRGNIAVVNGTVCNWGQYGIDGNTGYNGRFEGLSVITNGSTGLRVGFDGVVKGCVVSDNSNGINANSGNTLSDCTAARNRSDGILAGFGNTLRGCTARSNSRFGIYASYGNTVGDCAVSYNGDDGIYAYAGNTLRDCVAQYNSGDGIAIDQDNRLNGCVTDDNGLFEGNGAGIHVITSDNRIEGNSATDNDRGIDVDSGGNLIIRNSASGNGTNYVISGTQTIGPIITATGTITNENPWANFEF